MNVPPGYERLLQTHAVAVARSDAITAIRQALVGSDGTRNTLHEFAARAPESRALRGRGTAWATRLPGGTRVVVRHNQHGGLFAPLTGDRFLAPTRAPHELAVSLTLRAKEIATPEVVAYVLYPPGGIFQRSDVATAEIEGGRDLADVLERTTGGARDLALRATGTLVGALSGAGARHHDLNAKNVLIAAGVAYVLDVDRVTLDHRPESALELNLARLTRSLHKWRAQFGVNVTEAEIASVAERARARAAQLS